MDVERGAAWRRRQRRLRPWWRHEQQTVAAVLATVTHHSHSKVGTANDAPRSQKKVTSTRVGPAEYYEVSSDDGRPTGEERPEALLEPWPLGKMERHDGIAYELVQALDALVLQMVEQLPDVHRFFASCPPVVAERVVDVPKIILENIPSRRFCDGISERNVEQIVDSRVGEGLQDFLPGQSSSSSSHDPARGFEALDEPGYGFFALFPKIKKVRHNLRTRGRNCLRTRAHGRRLLVTRPWCLRRKRRSPWTSLSSLLSTCSKMGFGGVASGTQLTIGIAGGWPLPMGHRLAIRYGGLHGSSAVGHGDVATVVLGWCLVRQWIHVPASTYCGGASFSSSSKWWILLLFTETGTHSVKLCKSSTSLSWRSCRFLWAVCHCDSPVAVH